MFLKQNKNLNRIWNLPHNCKDEKVNIPYLFLLFLFSVFLTKPMSRLVEIICIFNSSLKLKYLNMVCSS